MRIQISKKAFSLAGRPFPAGTVYTSDRHICVFVWRSVSSINGLTLIDGIWRKMSVTSNVIYYYVGGNKFVLGDISPADAIKINNKLMEAAPQKVARSEGMKRLTEASNRAEIALKEAGPRRIHGENFLRMGDSDRSLKAARVNNADAGTAIFAREETHWATGSKTGRPQVAHKISKDAPAVTYAGKACPVEKLITVRLKFNGRTFEMILSPEEVAEWNEASTLEAKKRWLYTAHKAVVNESPDGVRALNVIKKADGTLDIVTTVQ